MSFWTNLWNPTNEFLAQSAHISWGGFLSLVICLASAKWWVALAVLLPLSALKEFVIDIYWLEETTTRQAEAVDFGFTCLGIGMGWGVWWFTGAK